MKIWSCKIGEVTPEDVPQDGDLPMRLAVEAAYRKLTGKEAEFTFSGWGAKLTESERAVVEDRLPDIDTQIKSAEERLVFLRAAKHAT